MYSGATASTATMMMKAIGSLQLGPRGAVTGEPPAAGSTRSMSGPPPEQAGRPHQQHDRHDDEDHGVGGLREEHLGEALDDAEAEAGEDGAHDRAHAADHH